jgi:hypothetical protein
VVAGDAGWEGDHRHHHGEAGADDSDGETLDCRPAPVAAGAVATGPVAAFAVVLTSTGPPDGAVYLVLGRTGRLAATEAA